MPIQKKNGTKRRFVKYEPATPQRADTAPTKTNTK